MRPRSGLKVAAFADEASSMLTLRGSARVVLVCSAFVAFVASSKTPAARAATITGSVGSASVVWISGPTWRGSTQEMRNSNKTFVPELLVVPVGGSVRFPNDDPFFHSIYSIADSDPFDIGFYETGPGKDVTFDRPGVLDVRCHIHASMHATIVVVDGPFQRIDGAFAFANVAAGETTVSAWNAADGLRTTRVRVGRGRGTVALPRAL